jgi:hypothetical protein
VVPCDRWRLRGRAAACNGRTLKRQALAGQVDNMRIFGVIRLVLAVVFLSACASSRHDSTAAGCPATPITLRLTSVAPAIGSSPVWMTGGSLGCWCGERPLKTAWILDRTHVGPLTVRGQSLSDGALVTFPGQADDRNLVFQVPNATSQSSAIPGGATVDELDRYAFHNGYVAYPHPGCFRLAASLGDQVVNLVVAQTRCPDCTVEPAALAYPAESAVAAAPANEREITAERKRDYCRAPAAAVILG